MLALFPYGGKALEKLISIIIPCYNTEKYIDRCFQSLVAQTIGIEQLELIFVDDCSTDNTWKHLGELETVYPESVMIIHCDENGRQGRARNIGLEYATAPYIGFVDADDWVESDMFEKLYRRLSENNCDIAMCRSWRDYAKPNQKLPPKYTGEENRILYIDTEEKRKMFLALGSIEFGVWNKLYRADLLRDNNIFFPEKLAYEDHFFATLLYFYAKKVYILEERLYHYYVNEQSTVLAPNATHHFDILTVDTMLWRECESRGLVEIYRQELEYQFLSLCYLMSMKLMILRMTEVPYDFFLKLKRETLQRIPDYHGNPYVKELVTDLNKIILELLDMPIDEQGLKILCDTLRNYMKQGVLEI